MERLFVYGTLRPGHVNAHILQDIGGEWLPGYVTGTFFERGWGAAADFRGSCLIAVGRGSRAICSSPITLTTTGQCWMNSKRVTIALPLKSLPMMVSA